jgi:hypothetical protein
MAGKPAILISDKPARKRQVSLEQKSAKKAWTFKIAKCDLKARAAPAGGRLTEQEPRADLNPFMAYEQGPTVSYVCILTARAPAWTLGCGSRCFRGLSRLYGAAAGGSPSTEGRADDCGSASHTCLHGYSLGGAVPCTCSAFHAGVPICNPSMPVTHDQHLVRAHHWAHATSHALFFVQL